MAVITGHSSRADNTRIRCSELVGEGGGGGTIRCVDVSRQNGWKLDLQLIKGPSRKIPDPIFRLQAHSCPDPGTKSPMICFPEIHPYMAQDWLRKHFPDNRVTVHVDHNRLTTFRKPSGLSTEMTARTSQGATQVSKNPTSRVGCSHVDIWKNKRFPTNGCGNLYGRTVACFR
jgi:hypothetical protein